MVVNTIVTLVVFVKQNLKLLLLPFYLASRLSSRLLLLCLLFLRLLLLRLLLLCLFCFLLAVCLP